MTDAQLLNYAQWYLYIVRNAVQAYAALSFIWNAQKVKPYFEGE